jgi:cytoskeletal protein RodZ
MRLSERLVLVIAIVLPVLLATLGWPRFVAWLSAPTAQQTPETAGASATPASSASATSVSVAGSTATVVATRRPTTPIPTVEPTQVAVANDPSATVAEFYALVANHDFEAAEDLWSPSMQSRFPPRENIVQRFSQTTSVQLRRADVVSDDGARAVVAVDLVETDARQTVRHFGGMWHLVRGPNGWLLDQPDLQAN